MLSFNTAWSMEKLLGSGAIVRLRLFLWPLAVGHNEQWKNMADRPLSVNGFFPPSFWNTPHKHCCDPSCGSSFHLGGGWRKVQARAHKTCLGLLRHQRWLPPGPPPCCNPQWASIVRVISWKTETMGNSCQASLYYTRRTEESRERAEERKRWPHERV